jgi:hypothetical protein
MQVFSFRQLACGYNMIWKSNYDVIIGAQLLSDPNQIFCVEIYRQDSVL